MSDCLDAMIAGRTDLVFQEEKDTLTGKLHSKMHRLYEILDQQSRENKIQRQQLETIVADIFPSGKNAHCECEDVSQPFAEKEPG